MFDFALMRGRGHDAENARDLRYVCMIRKGLVARTAKDHKFVLMVV